MFSLEQWLTIALFLASCFFTWLTTYIYFKKGNISSSLCYYVDIHRYLSYESDSFSSINSYYKGREIFNPIKFDVYIWNNGPKSIENSSISQSDPMIFGSEQMEVLHFSPPLQHESLYNQVAAYRMKNPHYQLTSNISMKVTAFILKYFVQHERRQ